MPELPEVQTVVTTLQPGVVGQTIRRVVSLRADIVTPLGAPLRVMLAGRRIESVEELLEQLEPWEVERNDRAVGIEWRFTTADARIKLRRLYPAIE